MIRRATALSIFSHTVCCRGCSPCSRRKVNRGYLLVIWEGAGQLDLVNGNCSSFPCTNRHSRIFKVEINSNLCLRIQELRVYLTASLING